MGRGAAGVRAIKISGDDGVIGVSVVRKGDSKAEVLALSSLGFGKKTKLKEYKVQKRGGTGIKTAKLTSKTGELISAQVVYDEEGEIVAISKKGQVIRVDLKEIPITRKANARRTHYETSKRRRTCRTYLSLDS